MVLFLFAIVSWSACFLIAEARFFGCDTTGYLDVPEDDEETDPFEWERYHAWVDETGIFKLRQKLLDYSFFRELFGCYYCLGSFWVGVPLHFAFRYQYGDAYIFNHSWEISGHSLVATVLAVLVSGGFAYSIDKILNRLDTE